MIRTKNSERIVVVVSKKNAMLFSRSLMLIGILALRKTTEEKTRILLLLHIPIRLNVWDLCVTFTHYMNTIH